MAQRSAILTFVAATLLIAIIINVSRSFGDFMSEPLCSSMASYFAQHGLNATCDSNGFFPSDVACVEDKWVFYKYNN